MGEYLPGTLQERLRELREANGYPTQQKLADELGIDKSTYGRIESGATKTVNSDLLIKLSGLYNVSTDYILGISDVPERTYYDIAELGLSVEAAGNLYGKRADPRVVNELLLNEKFLTATKHLENYFSDTAAMAFKTCNSLYDFAFDLTSDLINAGKLPKDRSVAALRKQIKACKVPSESFQLTKIQGLLMTAVREIKKKVTDEIRDFTDTRFTSEVLQTVKEEAGKVEDLEALPYEERKQYVIDAVKAGVARSAEVPEEITEQIDHAIEVCLTEIFDIWKTN